MNILSIIAGVLLTLTFAPFKIYPLAIISFVTLLYIWLSSTPAKAFWRGWLFGLGFFGTGIYWIFISVHTYGHASILAAGIITFSFIATLAIFPATCGYLVIRFFKKSFLFAFPAIWVILEWIRSWLFTGFPWLYVGYGQLNSPLRGYAPILSVYGVSFAILLSSALLLRAWFFWKKKQNKLASMQIIFFILIWLIGFGLNSISWIKPKSEPVQVSLVQGNIPQDTYWTAATVDLSLERYATLTSKHWDSKIIIWPESSLPTLPEDISDYINGLDETATHKKVGVIFGIPLKIKNTRFYNNAVMTAGAANGQYIKQHLVPFGETIPLRKLVSGLFNILNIPMSEDFLPGNEFSLLQTQGLNIATFICYEIAFPELVVAWKDRADLLLTVTNDAWFGESIANEQHLEMAQMRSLEMGKPGLFVANNGITAFIYPNGKIQAAAPPFQIYVLTNKIQPVAGRTPWQILGMWPLWLILFSSLVVAYISRRKP